MMVVKVLEYPLVKYTRCFDGLILSVSDTTVSKRT